MYMMGMYILPEGVHSAFDKELARFFWQAGDGRPKYHVVKWANICMSKDRGGLGIPASSRMKVALMLRWVADPAGRWGFEAKYLRGRPLLACSHSARCQFWKSIQDTKDDIRLGLRFSVGNGSGTQFWLDPSLAGEPLRLRFPRLFAICDDPVVLISAAALEDGWHFAFHRTLGPPRSRNGMS
ncbi:Heparanase-like protein 2 [Hordeum vulgare]|nr:Heparanase-like protein 2 [Hordeum vulgare]